MELRQLLYYFVLATVPFFTVSPRRQLCGLPVGLIFGFLILVLILAFNKALIVSFRKRFFAPVSLLPLFIFIGIGAASFVYSYLSGGRMLPENYLRAAYLILSGIICCLFAVIPNTPEELLTGVKIYIAASLLAALYGLYVTLGYLLGLPTGQIVEWSVPRLYGTATEPQVFGDFLISVLPLAVTASVLQVKGISEKFLLFSVWFLSLTLVMTFSAGAWAGGLAGTLLIAIRLKEIRWRSVLLTTASLGLVFMSILAVNQWLYPGYLKGFSSIAVKFTQQPPPGLLKDTAPQRINSKDSQTIEQPKDGNQTATKPPLALKNSSQIDEAAYQLNMNSVNERKWLREAAWRMFKEHPVMGVGLGNFGYLYNSYRPIGTPEFIFYARAHNQYLELLAEMGLIGFVCFLMVIIHLLIVMVRVLLECQDRVLRNIVFGLFACLTALAVHGYSFGILVHNYVWVVLGMTYAACRLALNAKEREGSFMKIGINAHLATGSKAGIGNYIYNLVKYLGSIDKVNRYSIFTGQDSLIEKPGKSVQMQLISSKLVGRGSWARILWEQFFLPWVLKFSDIEIMHLPDYAVPIFFSTRPWIITVHDVAFKLYPETFSRGKLFTKLVLIRPSLKKACKIIADSENTKRDLMNYYQVPSEKIKVIHIGVDMEVYKPLTADTVNERLRTYGLQPGYILYVGTLEPRKNVNSLIKAYKIIKDKDGISRKLVIVGSKGWLYEEIFQGVSQLGLTEDVIFSGYVPAQDLPIFYNGASVFVYPSIYEGFGLPPLEAMACGTPVITSNVSSLPEVVEKAGIMVDPQNIDALAQAMYQLVTDAKLAGQLSQRGLEQAQKFTWERTARNTLAVYEEVYNIVREGS